MKVVFRDHEWTIRKEYWSAIDSTSQSPTSSVERRKRQFRSWLKPREWRREKSKTSESIPLLQVWNQCQLRHYQQIVQARPPTVILTIALERLPFPQPLVRITALPVLFAPGGAFGFHHVEGERVARRLRAVEFTLMDNLTMDEDESTCGKESPGLLFSKRWALVFQWKGRCRVKIWF